MQRSPRDDPSFCAGSRRRISTSAIFSRWAISGRRFSANMRLASKGRYRERPAAFFRRPGGAADAGDRPHDFAGRARVRPHSADYYSFDRLFDQVHELGRPHRLRAPGDELPWLSRDGAEYVCAARRISWSWPNSACRKDRWRWSTIIDFLDLGYKLTALAGSDFPWCGRTNSAFRRRALKSAMPGSIRTLAARSLSKAGSRPSRRGIRWSPPAPR